MMKEAAKIVFMGTPDFAVASLKSLVEAGYRVVGVVTMPDKRSGRGMKWQVSPVKQFALDNQLPLLQPDNLKDPLFLTALKEWDADLQIVVAFRMLPIEVWSMPRLGTFNLHASLLPQYRGAAPIHWAVINGETKTGVTTFFLQQAIDTGDILYQAELEIGSTETTGSVYDRLMVLGAGLVLKTVDAILSSTITPRPQKELTEKIALKPAPKLFKENTRINWAQSGIELFNFIRGLSPFPVAWTELFPSEGPSMKDPVGVKIFEADFEPGTPVSPCGTILVDGKVVLKVAVADGFMILKRLQLAGKKPMTGAELVRGFQAIERYYFQ